MSDLAFVAALGIYFVVLIIIAIVFYVLYGISHMKALKAFGYDKPWMAWIPFANYFALADAVLNGEDNIKLFGSLSIPAVVFKFWWVIALVVSFIPVVGKILNYVLRIVCLGTCYIKIYAKLDGKAEQEVQALGYVSGFLPIVALFKFLAGKYQA